MAKIVIIGPAYPLRGGLATFDQRLCQQFSSEGDQAAIYSFSLQYPSFLFPGQTQYSTDPPPENIEIHSVINSVNPFNWLKVGYRLKRSGADILVVRFWIPFMGPALGTILRIARKNKHVKIICIADNVIPHEHRIGDKAFTQYFLKSCNAFITMSEKVLSDLTSFIPGISAKLVRHPLYDTFGDAISKDAARKMLGLNMTTPILLFFGFIRQYKGLDILLKAMADERVRNQGIKLLIAGEFYEDETPYMKIIAENKLEDTVILRTNFIPDSEVRNFLCACDCVIQPYRSATQSGVTPLAYHFEKPMIVSNVGGLPDLVPDGLAGLVCEPEPAALANTILRFYELGENHFIPHLRTEKKKYSWANLTSAIKELAGKR